jgi:hypothetical protein
MWWSLVFRIGEAQDDFLSKETRFSGRSRRGNMNELVDELVAKAGMDDAVAEKAAGIMLDYLQSKGPFETVQTLIDRIPGAEAAIAAARNASGPLRLMGDGLMAVGTRLTALGLTITDIQKIARELSVFGSDKIGEDRMRAIIAGTPGLSHFA